jgi:peptidoglycan/LPS O-acetylase OafA/YrhL
MISTKPYRADIDGLRAIAVTPVVLFHAGAPGFSGGFIGVDIFFVISGYLITELLFHEAEQTGSISIINFYARRIRRIFPSIVVVVFATLTTGALLLSATVFEIYDLSKSAIAAMAFVANFYFLQAAPDYFARSASDFPLLHTWSLAIEEQYYLVWPLLILAATRLGGRSIRVACLSLIVIITVGSIVLCAALMSRWGAAAFFLPVTRAWELGAGSALALVTSSRPARQAVGAAVAAFGLVLIGAGVALVREHIGFPFPWALVPVGGTVLLLWGNVVAPAGAVTRLLSTSPFVSIGKVSYAWYLWHWPLLSFAQILTLGESDWMLRFLLVGASLILAYLTTWFVEKPIRFGTGMRLEPLRTIGAGLVAATLVVTSAGVLYLAARSGYIQGDATVAAAFHDRPSRQELCLARGGSAGSDRLVSDCLVKDDAPRVVLWGDSYADHWAPAIERWSSGSGRLPLEQLTKIACPPLLRLIPSDPLGAPNQPYDGCARFNLLVEERLTESRTRFVVIAANWAGRAATRQDSASTSQQFFDYRSHTAEESLTYFGQGLTATLEWLDALNIPVVVVLQSPTQKYFPPTCVVRLGAQRCTVPVRDQKEIFFQVDETIRRSVAQHRNAMIFDPMEVLCDTT